MRRFLLSVLTVALVTSVSACGKKPPVAGPVSTSPNPFPGAVTAGPPPTVVPPPPVAARPEYPIRWRHHQHAG